MPRLTRRLAIRAGLAAGGTVVGVVVARKLTDGIGPSRAGLVEPPLQTLAGLRPITPPARLPTFTWRKIAPDGDAENRTIADHAGRGVVLNIWATWCGPCTREMPSLARLAADLRQAGIDVLPVSIDQGGAAAVRTFYALHAIAGLPVLVDPDPASVSSLGVAGIPTTFLVGPDGRLRARLEGAADWGTEDAIASVRRLIGS